MTNEGIKSVPEEATRRETERQLKIGGAMEISEGRLEITRKQLRNIHKEMVRNLQDKLSGEKLGKTKEVLSIERIPQQKEIADVIMAATGVTREDLTLIGGTLDAEGNPITLYFGLNEKTAQDKYGEPTEFAYMIEGNHPGLGGSMYTRIDRIHQSGYVDEQGNKDYEYGVNIARYLERGWWQPIELK